MKNVGKIGIIVFLFLLLILLFTSLIHQGSMQLLQPQGYIADIQSQILWGALFLAAGIGLPLVGITLFIAFHYREGNKKATYRPTWTGSKTLVFFWWAIPASFIIGISLIIWSTAHAVDPYKSLALSAQPITIQVVALRWKWLFLYPEQHIATVNYLAFPVNTPINFQLTADAPMNSFWIPRLGGQIYAMAGMVTQLHFAADTIGDFPGGGAEMSGAGFSGMQFTAHSLSQQAFATWVHNVTLSKEKLDKTTYDTLSQPTTDTKPAFYRYEDVSLYNGIVMKFMAPGLRMIMPKTMP